jgi:cysteine desulfurase
MTNARPIYLDHAATTPLRTEVAEAIRGAEAEGWANPSSPHASGRRAKMLLEEARERILELVGARPTGPRRDRLVFTSGATEANRLALLGMAGTAPGLVATSARDHAGLTAAAADLAGRGWMAVQVPLASTGPLDPDWRWPGGRGLLATTLVCGQTGTLEDMARIAATAAATPGLLVHCDATQAVACHDVSFATLGSDTLAFAPHKFGGPRGIGALVARAEAPLAAVTPGTQEAGLRGGTEPVPLAVGFARALELAIAERAATAARLRAVERRFTAALLAAAADVGLEAFAVGNDAGRSPHLVTIALPGIDRQAFVMAADVAGVCCATGTACASGSSEPAAVFAALGLPRSTAESAVRFSFGHMTTAAEVDVALDRLRGVLARLARLRG